MSSARRTSVQATIRSAKSPARDLGGLPVRELREALLAWYDRAQRSLPWRSGRNTSPDPWGVLVSEFMLQQTTVATVRSRYASFLSRFPTAAAMAAAPVEDVLHAWQGLGYYRRARALHACAQGIMDDHGGGVPLTSTALVGLPGIGPYTAAAVAAIAGGEAVVPVDGNVERVLARLLAVEAPLPAARPYLRDAAQALADENRSSDLAQAVMELGALVCTPRRPGCLTCPWRTWCRAAARGDAAALPRRVPRRARPQYHAVAFLLKRRMDDAILLRRRPMKGILGGMVELPTTAWHEDRAAAQQSIETTAPLPALTWVPIAGEVRHAFTHLELTISVVQAVAPDDEMVVDGFWARPATFAGLALPTLTVKVMHLAGLAWPT